MNRTRRLVLAVVAAVAVTACGTATADATTPTTPTPPAATCHSVDGKTDRRCTPGAINPQVTQANIASTICRKGWTKTVRPPVSVTNRLKRQQMRDYGLAGPASGFEEDHLIPLELGGSPADPKNLWPQSRTGTATAGTKDVEENALNRAVCNGRIKLPDAQRKIVADWVAPGTT